MKDTENDDEQPKVICDTEIEISEKAEHIDITEFIRKWR